MTNDYLADRLNVVAADRSELNAKLAVLVDVFGEQWLKSNGGNPLQLLWARKDVLATNELLNFGDAVERHHGAYDKWIRHSAKIIKTGDAGQVAGALFEIVALNLFERNACRVVPAPESMPGFDGTVHLKNDTARVCVSVKNHGISAREREFLAEAGAFDLEFQAQLEAHFLRDLEINVVGTRHLDSGDFRSLKIDIATLLADFTSQRISGDVVRPYVMVLRGLSRQYAPLSAFGNSTSCRIITPIAKNEQANFEDAIRKGCENLYAHTRNATGEVCRMIMLRLSNAASTARCQEWATWYFKEYPDEPVDAILLYQPAVTTNLVENTDAIVHHVAVIEGPRLSHWQQKADGSQRRLPNISFLVGYVSAMQSKMQLVADGDKTVDLENHYIYQRADVYQKVELSEGVTANFSTPAPGTVLQAILEQNGTPVMTLAPQSGREKSLVLFP